MSSSPTPAPVEPTSPELRRIASGCDWHGYLTLANLDAVADRLRGLVGEGQRYTQVICNEGYREGLPEVHTSLTAMVTVSHKPFEGDPCGSISVESARSLWVLITSVADQGAARALPEKNRPPYVRFRRDQVEVTDWVPAGFRTYTVLALEERLAAQYAAELDGASVGAERSRA